MRKKSRVFFLRLLDCSFETRCAMCLVVSDRLRGMSIHATLTYEGPASLVKLFFAHSSFLCLTHSFRPYIRDTPGGARNVLHLGALSVPSRIGGERSTRTYLTVTRWFVTFGAHACLLSSHFTVWQAFCCCCFCVRIFFVRLGLPMETLLDPCWGIVPEGLLGGMGIHRR